MRIKLLMFKCGNQFFFSHQKCVSFSSQATTEKSIHSLRCFEYEIWLNRCVERKMLKRKWEKEDDVRWCCFWNSRISPRVWITMQTEQWNGRRQIDRYLWKRKHFFQSSAFYFINSILIVVAKPSISIRYFTVIYIGAFDFLCVIQLHYFVDTIECAITEDLSFLILYLMNVGCLHLFEMTFFFSPKSHLFVAFSIVIFVLKIVILTKNALNTSSPSECEIFFFT